MGLIVSYGTNVSTIQSRCNNIILDPMVEHNVILSWRFMVANQGADVSLHLPRLGVDLELPDGGAQLILVELILIE